MGASLTIEISREREGPETQSERSAGGRSGDRRQGPPAPEKRNHPSRLFLRGRKNPLPQPSGRFREVGVECERRRRRLEVGQLGGTPFAAGQVRLEAAPLGRVEGAERECGYEIVDARVSIQR